MFINTKVDKVYEKFRSTRTPRGVHGKNTEVSVGCHQLLQPNRVVCYLHPEGMDHLVVIWCYVLVATKKVDELRIFHAISWFWIKIGPGNSLWPFWGGYWWPFQMVVGDLPRLGMKFGHGWVITWGEMALASRMKKLISHTIHGTSLVDLPTWMLDFDGK